MAGGSLLTSFLGALQASLSVLLTIFYGVIAGQFELLTQESASKVSKICVSMFMPALLISNVGAELHAGTAMRYVPVVIWGIIQTCVSLLIGTIATKVFKAPAWTTPAVAFNNNTSLPLLLIQALESTGILKGLMINDSDSMSAMVERATSYFLVNSVIGNVTTFAVGPRLLASSDETRQNEAEEDHANGNANGDIENGHARGDEDDDETEAEPSNEQTPLLPDGFTHQHRVILRKGYVRGKRFWDRLPPWVQSTLDLFYAFLNPPFIGAVIAVILGLTPPLHRAWFNSSEDGGVLNAWLATSVKNIGSLFATLQVVNVGVKLSSVLQKSKSGEESGKIPWASSLYVLFVRFILWPAISISIIFALASKANVLPDDPVLWFALMIIPTGPSAMNLTSLADVSGSDDVEKFAIAKFLTVSKNLAHYDRSFAGTSTN